MPIYEYKCKKCGSEFEVFQKITDSGPKSCKFCRGPVNRLISLSSFQLQGSGWYVTDYGGKKPKSSDGKKEDSESETKTKKDDSVSTTDTKD
jgi:putative FmdB family regulatory protein